MIRYIAAAAVFAFAAAALAACNAELPPNDAPQRGGDPRGASETMQSQAASSSIACHQHNNCMP